jgi:voltage-gated potassium channel
MIPALPIRATLHRWMHRRGPANGSRLFDLLSNSVCTAGLVAMIANTGTRVGSQADVVLSGIVFAAWAFFAATWAWRLVSAPGAPAHRGASGAGARLHYLRSPSGWIDLVAALALPTGWVTGLPARDAQLLAIVWALKYVRQSSGLTVLLRVLRRAFPALIGVVTVFFVILVIAATLAYVFEREAQPQAFGSIPKALWWAIVTLSTTGYGDMVPATLWGRTLAASVMVSGIVIFALWAGIIANAFAEELQRRHFLKTWDLVAEVPFFKTLGAAAVADIVRLLHARDVAVGTVVIREGQAGDSMYFIVSGEATAMVAPKPVVLGPGAFFGEMALLYGTPRSTTVVATEPCVLLVLDVADFRVLAGRRPELLNVIEAEGRRRREENAAPRNA